MAFDKYITRKIFKSGHSKAINLPYNWINAQGNDYMTMIYNNDILIIVSSVNIDKALKLTKDKVNWQ